MILRGDLKYRLENIERQLASIINMLQSITNFLINMFKPR